MSEMALFDGLRTVEPDMLGVGQYELVDNCGEDESVWLVGKGLRRSDWDRPLS